MIIAGNTSGESYIVKMNPITGKLLWKANAGDYLPQGLFFNRNDKSVYLLNSYGIQRFDYDKGHSFGYFFETGEFFNAESGTIPNQFIIDESNCIYFCLAKLSDGIDKEKYWLLLKYKPQLAKSDQRKVLSCSGKCTYKRVLDLAANKFEKEKSGWRIDQTGCFRSIIYTDEYKNDLKRLNTLLMAGKGADILFFSSFDNHRKYLEKGFLVDLSNYMERDSIFTSDAYNSNIINGCRYQGKQYLFPIEFSFPIMLANRNVLSGNDIRYNDSTWTWDDFLSIIEKIMSNQRNASKSFAIAKQDDGWIKTLYYHYYYKKYIDIKSKKSSFNSVSFVNELNRLKKLISSSQNPRYSFDEMFYSPEQLDFFFNGLKIGDFAFCTSSLNSFSGAHWNRIDNNIQMLFYPQVNRNEREYGYYSFMLCGINRNSKNKDEAWEFIKLLLSDEIQASTEILTFSINRNGQFAKIESLKNGSPQEQERIIENHDNAQSFINQATSLHYEDFTLGEIFTIEVKKFLRGEKTAEETTKIIQGKTETYLQE